MIKILAAFALLPFGLTEATAHPAAPNQDNPKVNKTTLCSTWVAEVKAHKIPKHLEFVLGFQNGFMAQANLDGHIASGEEEYVNWYLDRFTRYCAAHLSTDISEAMIKTLEKFRNEQRSHPRASHR